jgi:hypothetical protein
MDSTTVTKLHDVFGHFSNSPDGIDGVHFARLCRDLNLELVSHNDIPGVPATTFDIIFARAKCRTRRRLDFNQFLIALDLVGQRLGLAIDEVIRAACTIKTDDQLAARYTGPQTNERRGPEKFYYDQTTYTGTQKYRRSAAHRDEEETMSGRAVDLKEVVNRDSGDRWLGARTPQKTVSERRPHTAPHRLDSDITPLRGPARFYYDKSTYTGVHKYSTPTRNPMEKENIDPTPRRSTAKVRKELPQLPETAAASMTTTPFLTSSAPVLMTPDEFLAAELNIMPLDDYFSSFLRRY